MSLNVTVHDRLEALVAGADPARFRIGVVLPMTGVLGQVSPSAFEAVLLAASEVNQTRRSSDRRTELVLIDAGVRPATLAARVADLAAGAVVDAFVGLHTSDALPYCEAALSDSQMPYLFTAGHEERARPPGFICTGESCRLLAAGLARVMQERDVTDWAIIGTDYIWPRTMRLAVREVIEAANGRVVFDRILPLGGVDRALPGALRELVSTGARGVVVNMPGADLITTLQVMRALGLDRTLVRYSGGIEENVLYAIGGDRSGNLYAATHSFSTLESPRRRELNERYRVAAGDAAPVLNSWAEHCYDGVHMLAGLESSGLLAAPGRARAGGAEAREIAARQPTYEMHLALATGMTFQTH